MPVVYSLVNSLVKWKLYLDWHVNWAWQRLPPGSNVLDTDLRNVLRLVTYLEKPPYSYRKNSRILLATPNLFNGQFAWFLPQFSRFVHLIHQADADAALRD